MRLRSFLSLVREFTLRPLLQHRLRSLLTVGGVALGLAVVGAVHLSTKRAVSSFSESLDLVEGRSDFHVEGSGFPLQESWLREFAWFWEFGTMTPRLEGRARTPDGTQVRVYGVDLIGDTTVHDYFRRQDLQPGREHEKQGTDPSSVRLKTESFLQLLEEDRQILVPESLAHSQGLQVGSEVNLNIGGRMWNFEVGSILDRLGIAAAFGGNLIIMDIATAQDVLGKVGVIDRIDFKLDDSRQESALHRMERQIAGRLTLHRKGDLSRQSSRMLGSFQLNLRVLSYLALMVGVILIYNTVGLSAISRRSEVAILRALGTSRRVVFALFLAEALVLGLVGTVAGVLLAPSLSSFAELLVGRTVGEFYGGGAIEASSRQLEPVVLIALACVGVGVAIASGIRPAWSATRLAPVEVLREGSWSAGGLSPQRGLALTSAVLLSLGCLLSFGRAVNGIPVFGYLACLLFIAGFALGALPAMRMVLNLARRWILPWVGVEARLALRQLHGNTSRVILAVVSLMIAASMFVGVSTMVGSFRTTVQAWIHQTFVADLFLRAAGASGGEWSNPLPVRTISRIEEIPGVEAVGTFRGTTIDWEGVPVTLAGAGFQVLEKHGRLLFMDWRSSAEIVQRARVRDRVLVSEPFSRRFGVARGDEITLRTLSGPRSLEVEATYYDYSSDRGAIVMDRSLFDELFGDRSADTLAVYIGPGADSEIVSDRIRSALSGQSLSIQPTSALRAAALRVFDRTFRITYGLEIIALIVAALGVTNTLAALILERRGEFSLLRFLGAFKKQIRRITLAEAMVLGLAGCLLGLALGLVLSLLLIYVINLQSFGWTIQFDFPFVFVAGGLTLILLVTVVAGIYPALLASRMDALRALRTG